MNLTLTPPIIPKVREASHMKYVICIVLNGLNKGHLLEFFMFESSPINMMLKMLAMVVRER